jgi:hypothetical protein
MDRRDFLRWLLASPLAAPLLSIPAKEDDHSTLYLIADSPQDYLPALLAELRQRGLVREARFSFRGPHPFSAELRTALLRKGWEFAGAGRVAALALDFQPLRQAARPSFTFIRKGRVWDLRDGALGMMWREINGRSGRSSCLTIASASQPSPSLFPGRSAAVFVDGRKVDSLSLDRDQERRFRTPRGEVLIGVRAGRAEVLASSCRHKICQSSAPALLTGERIVCAPNHFLWAVDGPRFVDTVTG